MDKRAFSRAYKNLNKDQKMAVDAVDGPVMVIAGPGTGKTNILTLRIANILRVTDTAPENILALTFTESGVYSMRKKLVDIIGSSAYRVVIATFHGFCNDIIQKYPDEFKNIAGGTHIGSVDQIKLLEEIITSTKFSVLRAVANPHFYLHPALQKIGELKKDAITPRMFAERLRKEKKKLLTTKDHYHQKGKQKGHLKGIYEQALRGMERSSEFLKIYTAYEDRLKRGHFYDYDDMIIEVIKTLKGNKNFLLELEEQYHYILADEHQDANMGQNTLLELLSSFHSPYPNLFIVGDEKQAIFRFQGASLENFNYFRRLYPKAKLITLTVNYRSTQMILDAAGSVMKHGESVNTKLRERLISKQKQNGMPCGIYPLANEEEEAIFISEEIQRMLKGRVSPGEIAVLYRDNKDAFLFADILHKKGIPHTVLSDRNILEDVSISKFIMLLRAIFYFGEDAHIIPILHYDIWGIDNLDVYKIITRARKEKRSIYDGIRDSSFLKQAGVKNKDIFMRLYKKLSQWKTISKNEPFVFFFETVMHDSGFMSVLLSHPDAKQKLDAMERLYREIGDEISKHNGYSLSDFLRYVELITKYNVSIGARDRVVYNDTVHLMTTHRAKGLEFSYVFIVGATDGHWGNRKMRAFFPLSFFAKNDDTIDDERRLFYVALTRAKKNISITYPKRKKDGKQLLPSQFIEEIDKRFRKEHQTPDIKNTKNLRRSRLLLPPKEKTALLKEKNYLSALFMERGLSVTAFNNYLKCPWRYFYVNLLRIPKLETSAQLYGTAMHEALYGFFLDQKKGENGSTKKLVARLKISLQRATLSEEVFQEFLKRGGSALVGYYKKYHMMWTLNSVEEFPINGVFLEKDIKLRGKIDRMIFGEGNKVDVVDYKTGVPRSRNYILGTTKDSSGDYKRQLVFYKILLSLYDNGRFNMEHGVIDFLEPDQKGRYRREVFIISDEEMNELKSSIKVVADEIQTLSFWNKRCSDTACEFCEMRFKENS